MPRCAILALIARHSFHVHLEARRPSVLGLKFSHDVVRALTIALPSAPVDLRLAVLDIRGVGKYECFLVRRHRSAAEAAVALDIEILDLMGYRVPEIDGLAKGIRLPCAAHRVAIAQKLTVIDPTETMLVALFAARKNPLPRCPAR